MIFAVEGIECYVKKSVTGACDAEVVFEES